MEKPGKNTTEFWLYLLAHLVSLGTFVAGIYLGPDHWALAALGAAGNVLAALGYGKNRSEVKKAASQLEAARELTKLPPEKK